VFLDPNFEGGVVAYVKDGVVIHLALNTRDVMDLAPLRALRGLQRLNLSFAKKGHEYEEKFSDLSPLRDLRLKALYFNSPRVNDLSALKDMPLEELYCSYSRVSDLSPLKGKQLTILDVDGTEVRDLSPLRDMPLKSLSCRPNSVDLVDVVDQNVE